MKPSILQPVFSVSELNETINQHLSLLEEVCVEAELSQIDVKNNRLIFGSIKDNTSSMDIFSLSHIVKNYAQFEPGMQVSITGTLGLYKQSSRFRLMVTSMIPKGEGSLQIAFEKLKQQLETEGLFAPERKRALPAWPTTIGLITAKNSSAYHDVIKIITNRMTGLTIKLLPVTVQGTRAIPSILDAFTYVNTHPTAFDVVIMTRGGGSLEDLIAFNSEEIARVIYACKVPVISAIGHEDNWSLTDYVADVRASTPSNAAEMVVADKKQVIHDIVILETAIKRTLNQIINDYRHAIFQSLSTIKNYQRVIGQQIDNNLKTITNNLNLNLKITQTNLAHLISLIESLNIQSILNRGFSITRSANTKKIITSAKQVSAKDQLHIQLAQGDISTYVK